LWAADTVSDPLPCVLPLPDGFSLSSFCMNLSSRAFD
jgi:hypothetical protein